MEKQSNKIRIYLKSPAHRKIGYIIPIIEDNGRFKTGQDLTYEQMIGKELLTESQKLKYPFVINPEVSHKIMHNINMDRNDPEVNAKITLAILSESIAESKMSFNPGKHEGYIIDPIADANIENKTFDKVRIAMDIVGNTKKEDLEILVLLVSLQHNSPNADGLVTPDLQIQYLYKVAINIPDNIINSDARHNSSIKDQLFIAYCIKHKLIRRKGNNYVIEESGKEVAYLGTTMIKTISYLENNPIFKDKLQTKLQEVEPYYMVEIEKQRTIGENLIPIDILKNNIYISIHGIPGVTDAKNKVDLSKAKDLLDEYYERSGNSYTNDYKVLYKEFLKKQLEFAIDNLKVEFAKKNTKMIEACTINGPFAEFRNEVKALETEEEKREFMLSKYIDRKNTEYEAKLQEIDNL